MGRDMFLAQEDHDLVLHQLAIRLVGCVTHSVHVVVHKCTVLDSHDSIEQKRESIITLFMGQLPTGHPGNEYQFQIM
jgi:hypothetical protein